MRSSLVSKESVFSLFCTPIWPPWRYVKTIYGDVFVTVAIAIAKASHLFQNNETVAMLEAFLYWKQSKVKMTVRLNVVLNRTTGRMVTHSEIIISALLLPRRRENNKIVSYKRVNFISFKLLTSSPKTFSL